MGPVSLEELTNPQHEAPAVGRYLRQYLAAAGGQHQLIVRFLDLVERLLTAQPGLQQARALLHVVGVVPQQLAPRYRVVGTAQLDTTVNSGFNSHLSSSRIKEIGTVES